MSQTNDIKQEVSAVYDERAERYGNLTWVERDGTIRLPEKNSGYYFVNKKVRYALEMSAASKDHRLLEVGCSYGQMTGLLSKEFSHVTALDMSKPALDVVERKFKEYGISNVDFVEDDAEVLASVEDGSYDRVYSFSAIRYCSDVQAAVHQAYRALKNGGIAVIDFPNRLSPWHIIFKKSLGIKTHVNDHLFTRAEVREMFEKAGFKSIELKNILFLPRSVPNKAFPFFKIANGILERIPLLNRLSGVIMVKGQKHEESKSPMDAASV
ncbi:MAG: hypothetical protein CL946_05020 [Ectothiorhodospiraceae bacterium]|nr:hypothetical protein [Ectothiorhodospiraceae bacterium]